MTAVAWPDVDPADWETEEAPMTEEFAALACAVAAKKHLDAKLTEMRRARAIMRRAHDALQTTISEANEAIAMVEQSAREWARLRGLRHVA